MFWSCHNVSKDDMLLCSGRSRAGLTRRVITKPGRNMGSGRGHWQGSTAPNTLVEGAAVRRVRRERRENVSELQGTLRNCLCHIAGRGTANLLLVVLEPCKVQEILDAGAAGRGLDVIT